MYRTRQTRRLGGAGDDFKAKVRIELTFERRVSRGLLLDLRGSMGSSYYGDLRNIDTEQLDDHSLDLEATFVIAEPLVYNWPDADVQEHVETYIEEILRENLDALYPENKLVNVTFTAINFLNF